MINILTYMTNLGVKKNHYLLEHDIKNL